MYIEVDAECDQQTTIVVDWSCPSSAFVVNGETDGGRLLKLALHGADADTDTDTDFLADILARIVARMSACP